MKSALAYAESHFDVFKAALVDLCRIPSVSAAGFPPAEVRRSAAAMAAALETAGLEHGRILELPGVHPYVYADWLRAPNAPTVLVYGHHDVVPPGRPEKWATTPFDPVERGGRLYGRGAADDKGGIMAHVAAVASYLATSGALPCNVKFLVEGEEEIGSGHLASLLEAHAGLLKADVVVLSDTSNFATGVPALTYRLRGLCQVDVEVHCLERPVHSGQKGGPVPDAVRILCGLIAELTSADGSLAVPGLYKKVRRTSAAERARLRKLPFRDADFRKQAGMVKGAQLAGEKKYSVYERLWTRPSLTVIAMESHPFLGSANQILDSARARLSLRTVPDMDSREAGELLVRKLTQRPPFGAQVTARIVRSSPPWATNPEGPAFDAARRALASGFGRKAVLMGSGGSIGFVRPFSEFLKGAPCLLTGVEDPACNAHSENESLHLGDWKKCIRSAIHLYAELALV